MAQRANLDEVSNPLHDAYACLLANGLDGAGEALRILVNEASRIERRTRVATLFPNTASCLRLVSAILAEQDEEWMTAKIYLTMKP